MKKIGFWVVIVLALTLSACGKQDAQLPETTENITLGTVYTEATEPPAEQTVPVTEAATEPTESAAVIETTAPPKKTVEDVKPSISITKSPTDETVDEGGSAFFIAKAENAEKTVWIAVSPDTKTVYELDKTPADFPGLTIEGQGTETLKLSNIPYAMNGWRIQCYFTGNGGPAYTKGAYITVRQKSEKSDSAPEAFQKALRQIHDELCWPALPNGDKIDLWEPGTIEDETFAVYDVDGDGEDELLVSIFNTYVAGMCEVIYGYDAKAGGVRVEAWNYVGVTHYPGMLKVDAAHNHGYAGEVMWPYDVLRYDPATDTYQELCSVDAWDKSISDYDSYRNMSFPDDIDTEHEGVVYRIQENGQDRFLSRKDFEAWEAELFAQKEPLNIPWQNITAQNIGSIR